MGEVGRARVAAAGRRPPIQVVFCTAACAARYTAGLDRRFPDATARSSATRDAEIGDAGSELGGGLTVDGASAFPAKAAGV
jgi:hypothetical protein